MPTRRPSANGRPSTDERRDFDLNIEKVLDGWTVAHALREIIANALDEQALTGTAPVRIERERPGVWRIRDFGRGLRHTHLTQNENPEKLKREREVIGRFGVGLKDALAVLDRHGVRITLASAHGVIVLTHRAKAGFEDVRTLHARIAPPRDPKMIGTEVTVGGIRDADMEAAKGFFLQFSGDRVLETTRVGQILGRRPGTPARIYVKALVVAEEPDFAFSYNITALTAPMRKALNRERTNVGRTAYADRVKAMLLEAETPAVAEVLAHELPKLASGTACEEIRTWSDVGLRACQILNATKKVVFVTTEQLVREKDMVDQALSERREVITVPLTIAAKLGTVRDLHGQPLQSLEQYAADFSASFTYRFVEERALTTAERAVFGRWREIAALGGGVPKVVKAVRISETMRPSMTEGMNPQGLWVASEGWIIIHRPQLRRLADFAGTLLHELAHARTGYDDVSREFEDALTDTIGTVAAKALGSR